MHRNGVRSDHLQCSRQLWRQRLADLSQADIADQQHVGGEVADFEAGCGGRCARVVAEHDALRSQHHAYPQLLGGSGQIAVDGAGQVGAAGHRPDQHRGPQR